MWGILDKSIINILGYSIMVKPRVQYKVRFMHKISGVVYLNNAYKQTSPPSARAVAMSSMTQQNYKTKFH